MSAIAEAFEFAPVLLKGNGWRVGWMPERSPYCALVGGNAWAFELTEAEWQDLCGGVRSLLETAQAVGTELMKEETLTLEHVTDRLRLVSTGDVNQPELYLQLHRGRLAEGSWSVEATSDFMAAVQRLGLKSGAI
ncbi:MAG: DUF1818 family protein [Cyanobacteria bacterium J06639_1]